MFKKIEEVNKAVFGTFLESEKTNSYSEDIVSTFVKGKNLVILGKYQEALIFLLSCLERDIKIYGKNHYIISNYRNNIGMAYTALFSSLGMFFLCF